jgi:aminopeptidase N
MRSLVRFMFFAVHLLAGIRTGMAQPKGYDVLYYNAKISLDRTHDQIAGSVTMTARAETALHTVLQHAKYLSIDSVFIATTRLTTSTPDSAGAYLVTLPNAIASGVNFTITTFYHGTGRSEGGSFSWGGVTDSAGMMFAMGVGFTAPYTGCTRHWLPCYDLPDDKADSVDLFFMVADSDVVASNGLLVEVLPAKEQHVFHWHVSHPIATYLLTFASGVFQKLRIQNALGIPFEVYAFAKDTLASDLEMTNHVAPALQFFDSLFGKYPFEKVGYVLAPFGSMEHQTMVTLDHSALAASSTTAQHELSHQWWGDRVTCKTFDDAWLNEGFATYCESLVLERFSGVAAYWSKQKGNIAGAIGGGSTNALYGAPGRTSPRNNYPYAIIYQKGAAVLGMLRYFIGDVKFFTAIRAYGDRHAYSTATSFDLQSDMEQSTGQDLNWFFSKWVFGTGYPQLKITSHHGGNDVSISLQQVQDTLKYGFFRLPLIVEGRKNGAKERVPIWLDSVKITQAQVHFSFSPDSIVIDPDGAVIKKIVSQTLDVAEGTSSVQTQLRIKNNPVRNGEIKISIGAGHSIGRVKLDIINETGSLVKSLLSDTLASRSFEHAYALTGVGPGVYFLRFSTSADSTSILKFIVE